VAVCAVIGLIVSACGGDGEPSSLLIIDDEVVSVNESSTPELRYILERSGLFDVAVVTAPRDSARMHAFSPPFDEYDVIMNNSRYGVWGEAAREAFDDYVSDGGGLVVIGRAAHAFPEWQAYNHMVGLSAFGGRDESAGPHVWWRDSSFVYDYLPGAAGIESSPHSFTVNMRETEHPASQGIPVVWMHAPDVLFGRLRGPAKNMAILATAFSDRRYGGSGRVEPVIMAVNYGHGRVFHMAIGNTVPALSCAGFQESLIRGAEWAARGEVSGRSLPDDFPEAAKISRRRFEF
jgi:hypothetical protein